jgi:hypothetical protein
MLPKEEAEEEVQHRSRTMAQHLSLAAEEAGQEEQRMLPLAAQVEEWEMEVHLKERVEEAVAALQEEMLQGIQEDLLVQAELP